MPTQTFGRGNDAAVSLKICPARRNNLGYAEECAC